MKVFSKLLYSFWVITLLAMLSLVLPVNASGPSISPILCGEHVEVSIAYDGASSSTFDYDLTSAHTANGKANRTRTDTAFGHIPAFLAAKGAPATWNEFQAATRGQFASRAEAGQAWAAYKDANGIVTGTTRSMAARSEYLRSLADNPNTASWMKPWLQEGRVPPGYEVDHIKPLSIGGPDTPANMRLQGADLHDIHPRYYRPWE